MAKFVTKFLTVLAGSANSGGVSGPWVDISDLEDPVFQCSPRPYATSANSTTPSAAVAVYGTYDDAHLNGSVVGRFRIGSYAVDSAGSMTLLVTSAYETGITSKKIPLKYVRLEITTLSAGQPSIMVTGRVNGLSDEA